MTNTISNWSIFLDIYQLISGLSTVFDIYLIQTLLQKAAEQGEGGERRKSVYLNPEEKKLCNFKLNIKFPDFIPVNKIYAIPMEKKNERIKETTTQNQKIHI